MPSKPRPLSTALLSLGIVAGLLLQGSAAQALPAPVAAQQQTTDPAAADADQDAADDGTAEASGEADAAAFDAATDGSAADGAETDEETTGADAETTETDAEATEADAAGTADAEDAEDPETVDPEQTGGEASAESDPESSDDAPLSDEDAESSDALLAAAAALPSSGFKAGYIITDTKFYDGTGMTAAQIQTFLEQRVPRCTIGDSGRTAGTSIYGSTVAEDCLRGATWTTSSRSANAYCKAYAGAANESAAKIIAKVARACSVSPQVLLVMLEKEQSLVSDTWPTVRQFDVAMGYACPDSGPNNSANCDTTQTGFMQQVYRAAWQLQVYKALNNYNYKPFITNTIQWHPDTSCGTSQVYIQNWATAALYIYTPYRPNQAALSAGWGTGDACSSYGNRNFYQFYKLWFGSPNTFFPDVLENHKFFTEIEWMGNSGLSTGIPQANGGAPLYKPSQSVTREAMAAFLYRLEGADYSAPKTSPFADVQPGDKFYKEITWMYAQGYTTGKSQPSGKPIFDPKGKVSREAMAAFIYRMKH
ncbi:MAG: S-layer homology domain-containing protein [Leucobacter sp.]